MRLVLRSERALKQRLVAETLWNLLLRAVDKRQADVHSETFMMYYVCLRDAQ